MSASEELAFESEAVKSVAKDSIETMLRNKNFDPQMINEWVSAIIEDCTKRLCAQNKPFKYISSCVIMQKTGAGLHIAASTYWDQTTDASVTVKWENTTMYAILSVYGIMI